MRMVRLAVLAVIAVAVGGAGYVYRDEVAQKLGLATASAAEKGSAASPAASAQPQGRRGRLNPGGPVPVVVTKVDKKPMPIMIEAVGTVQAIASIQIKSRVDSQIMKVNVEEGALVKEGRHPLRARCAHAEGTARPDRGPDPQGPGAGRASQARRVALRGPALQERRHGGQPRHRPDHAQGRRGAARSPTRPAKASVHDPAHLHRDPRARVGSHRFDLEQGRHRDPRRRQQRRERARHHQPGRSDLRRFRRAAGLPAGDPLRRWQRATSRSSIRRTSP